MPVQPSKLWLPESHTDKQLTTLNRALNSYDERLRFGRNEDTGDWCVFVLMPHGQKPVSIMGFGHTIPAPDEMMQRVMRADMRRFGDELLEEINAHNEKLRQPARDKAEDAEWQMAEGMESFLHAQGKTPYHRSHSKAVESRRTGGK